MSPDERACCGDAVNFLCRKVDMSGLCPVGSSTEKNPTCKPVKPHFEFIDILPQGAVTVNKFAVDSCCGM